MKYKTLLKLHYNYTEDMLLKVVYNAGTYTELFSLNDIFKFEYETLKEERTNIEL